MDELPDNTPKERRRTPRVFGTLVDYSLKGDKAASKNAFIKDIGMYGVCIYIPESVEKEDVINLNIFLYEDDRPVKAKGKIVWWEPGGYLGYNNVGIEFTEISEEDRRVLSEYIKENYKGS
jgi:hypothetical protein